MRNKWPMRTGHVAYERHAYFGSFMMHGNCKYSQLTQTVDFERYVVPLTVSKPQSVASLGYLWYLQRFHSISCVHIPTDAANPLEIMMVTPQWTRTALAVSFALGCPKGRSPRSCHCMVSPSRPTAKFSHNLNILVDGDGDGLSDGWGFVSWKGSYGTPIFTAGQGGQMTSFRVPPCHWYCDVHQQMTIISVTFSYNQIYGWSQPEAIMASRFYHSSGIEKNQTVLTCWWHQAIQKICPTQFPKPKNE